MQAINQKEDDMTLLDEGLNNESSEEQSQETVNHGTTEVEATNGRNTSEAAPSSTEQQPETWYFDDKVPGAGEKPEWLQSKYKSVSEQAKAYNEAQKRLGAFKGAPEEYDLSLADMPDVKLQKEDPMLEEFLADAKANNVSQDYVTNVLKMYVKAVKMNNPDPKKELEALGVNGKQDLKTLGNWARNHLSDSEVDVFKKMITTADTVRVFQKLRGIMTAPVTKPSHTQTPTLSKEHVLRKIHDPRYENDESFRNQVRDELAQFG
jgi:hypothetical protein